MSRDLMDAVIAEAARAGAREGAAAVVADLDARLERAVERVLDRRESGALLPFEQIIPSKARKEGRRDKAAAARAWLARHPEIKKLGVPVGKRLLFRRDEVLAAMKAGDR